MIDQHYNHPSAPVCNTFNEGWGPVRAEARLADRAKSWDPTRLINLDVRYQPA
ncbi:hypothetical protein [Streptomyces sp. KL116D]|uniref:hypothetical protein n=1 Tax=Streptomyces sp. KL116D TaxID=3045152 RepID=UPI003557642A